MISLTSNHLWSCVARGAASGLESGALLIHITETKIHNFECKIIIKEKVLGLEISVADSTVMDVLDTGDELKVELACLLLRKPCVLDYVVEEFTTVTIFHDHVELFFGFNNFIKLDDIGVSYLFEDLDFPSDSLNILLIMNFILFKNFNCHLFE